jgi:hypothetical protein
MVVGTSDGVGLENWDTDDTPELDIAAANGIEDAAGNVVCMIEEQTLVDMAAPVIAKAIAQTDTDQIVVTFSEGVTDVTLADLDQTDFTYIYYADSTDVTTVSSVAATADAAIWNLTTDDILTEDHVAMDSLQVVAGKVQDLATVAAYVNTVPISDIEIPYLISATTMDLDVDGYIDTIELVFSEEIRDENLNNWDDDAEADNFIVVPNPGFPARWAVEGYEVIGINRTTSDDDAETASDLVNADVYNVNDVADDNTLYLSIVEGDTPDTGERPLLSMDGDDAGGSGVGDYSPNYVPSISDLKVADGAGVALIDAMMTSTTTLEIKLSETLNMDSDYLDALLAVNVLDWKVGTQMKQWNDNVVNISFPTAFGQLGKTRMVFEVAEGVALEPANNEQDGWSSTVALQAGSLQDNSADNVVNMATPDPLEIDPPDAVAVEADLPGAFALEANYPNPFNPTTTINYAIPADGAGLVQMVIYNMNGQKVRTLVNETQDAGYYNVVWDGRNDAGELVSSGIYVYQIVSGSFTQNHKMTFIK